MKRILRSCRRLAPALFLSAVVLAGSFAHADPAKKVRIGYGPASVGGVVKDNRWLEDELKPLGVEVEWVQAFGSNRTFEFFRGNNIDFGASAGSASLIVRANGLPVKIALITNGSKEFLNALVAIKPEIRKVSDLRGRKVAVTLATETHWFLLAALDEAGVPRNTVTIVPLPPQEGRLALQTGAVDAYSGFGTEIARAELEHKARVIYTNKAFESFSVLNVSDRFARDNPDLTQRVIAAHNRARAWLEANPKEDEARAVRYSKLSAEAASLLRRRGDLSLVPLDRAISDRLASFGPILKELKLIDAGVDVPKLAREVLAPEYVGRLISQRQ